MPSNPYKKYGVTMAKKWHAQSIWPPRLRLWRIRTKHAHYTDCLRATEKFDSCCKYWVPTISSSHLVLTCSITCVWERLLRQEPTDHGVEARQALLNIIQRQLCRVRVHGAVTHARRFDVTSVCVWRQAIASQPRGLYNVYYNITTQWSYRYLLYVKIPRSSMIFFSSSQF